MAGEAYAFLLAFDVAFMVKHDLETVIKQLIPLSIFTESKQMFDVITCATQIMEKHLMIDVAAVRRLNRALRSRA